jgi:adenylosuccinate synthase
MIADIVVDLQYGDCGKGKVTHHLCKEGDYTHVVRYNGGCNAGHTIFHNGRKFITHHIPAGVFFGVKSIIGPGCVLDIDQFFKEIKELERGGIKTNGLIFIAKNTHIITKAHIAEDRKDSKIGTTKRGNGPAYRDKFARKGIRAEDVRELEPYLIDLYEEFYLNDKSNKIKILFEGAQGFGLDVDWGEYPYVTSSNCIAAAALANGVPPQAVRNVWGVAKAYETYVGAKDFQGDDPIFDKIQNIGKEFGATTGRKRQVNWMSIKLLKKATQINGVTHLVINKMDVLDEVNSWSVYDYKGTCKGDECKVSFLAKEGFVSHIQSALENSHVSNFYFSESAHHI